jgi:hypothetical protein
MIKRASAALFFVLGLGMQLALAGPINIVNNGDFELGSLGNIPGWTLAPAPGGELQNVLADNIGPAPHGGKVFFEPAGNHDIGYISQTLTTIVGAKYTLDFYLQRFDTSFGNVSVDNFAQVMFGGLVVFQEENVAGDWIHFSFADLTATSTSTLLRFGNTNINDYNQLDNVSVVKTSADPDVPPDPRALPEPGSTALVLAALGLLGWTRRRQS